MVFGISFITLVTSDLEKATLFYNALWQIEPRRTKDGMVLYELTNLRLVLITPEALEMETSIAPGNAGGPGVLFSANVSSKTEVERLISLAPILGGSIQRAPGETSWGGYAGFFADPDGHFWEAAWNPKYAASGG